MPWNSTWPVGTVSVKANRVTGQQNTTYIETTMGNSIVGTNTSTTRDHFWNVGTNEDGRHRWVQSPAFTVGGNAADATLGDGMDAAFYAKTTNSRVEWFHRNAQGIYQAVPSFLQGTAAISTSVANIVSVPANVYGEIFLYRNVNGAFTTQWGWFRSGVATVEAWSNLYLAPAIGPIPATPSCSVLLSNGPNASGLNIRAQTLLGTADTWNYRIIYRAL